MQKRGITISIHLAGCFVFLLLPVLFSPDLFAPRNLLLQPPFQKDLLTSVLLLAFFYLAYFVLIPELYFQHKFQQFIASVLLAFLAIIIIPEFAIGNTPPPHQHFDHAMAPALKQMRFEHGPRNQVFFLHRLGYNFFEFSIVLTFAILLRVYNRWKATQQEKLRTELSYLKAQINPHFLFNALNSIYAQAIEENADRTANAIVTLSGMMRYIITESHAEKVSLEKELHYIDSYINLQHLRLSETADVDYTQQVNNHEILIAPMVLIPFIENAFKYGVNPEKKSYIRVGITLTGNSLLLEVYNFKVSNPPMDESNGLGVFNAVQRLQFVYPGKHQLLMKETETDYLVSLTIDLT